MTRGARGGPRGRAASPLAACTVGQGAVGFLLGSLGGCLVLLARDLAVARDRLSWLSAGFGVALLLFGGIGRQLLRAGAGPLVRGAALALGAGAGLLALASSAGLAQAGALLLGLGASGVVLASAALLTGARAASRLTLVNAASSASGVAAPFLLSALDAWTGHGRIAMLLPIPAVLWLALVRVEPEEGSAAGTPAGAGPGAAPRPRARDVAVAWARIVLVVSAEFAFVVWGASRLQDTGLAPAAATAAAAAFQIGMATGRLTAPRVLHRLPLAPAGALLAAASAAVIALPVSPALATVALGLAGLGVAVLYPVSLARLLSVPGLPGERGAALSSAASGVAVLFAPILLSRLAGVLTLRTSFWAVPPVLALFLALDRHPRAAAVTSPSPPAPRRGRGRRGGAAAGAPAAAARPGGG